MSENQRKRDLTLLKQGMIVGIFLVATVLSPDIRGVLGGSVAVSDRVLLLEYQNGDHAKMQEQINGQMVIIDGLQQAQSQMIGQVEALSEMVDGMQEREYERLMSAKSNQ